MSIHHSPTALQLLPWFGWHRFHRVDTWLNDYGPLPCRVRWLLEVTRWTSEHKSKHVDYTARPIAVAKGAYAQSLGGAKHRHGTMSTAFSADWQHPGRSTKQLLPSAPLVLLLSLLAA